MFLDCYSSLIYLCCFDYHCIVLEEKTSPANNTALFVGLVLAVVVMYGLDTLIDSFEGHGGHGEPAAHGLEASLLKGANNLQNHTGPQSESDGQYSENDGDIFMTETTCFSNFIVDDRG